jgi:two-component system KDP operon response regulator KdpE
MDGLEVIKAIREWSEIPIVVLSARGQEEDKVTALELGADDYLTKPFGSAELLARLKVAQRHARNQTPVNVAVFENGDLKVDVKNHLVFLKKEEIHLTPTEFKLLAILVKHAGKIVTYKQLLQEVWGKHSSENNHYLRIYTQHLRQKLQDDPLKPRYIITEAGIGYRLKTAS